MYMYHVLINTSTVENPDIRPTDYESFLYDPEDPFSADESEPEKVGNTENRTELDSLRDLAVLKSNYQCCTG